MYRYDRQPVLHLLGIALVLFLLAAIGGCMPQGGDKAELFVTKLKPSPDAARFNGFLTLKDVQGPAIRMQVADLQLLANDVWLPFVDGPLTIDSAEIDESQLFLGAEYLPPGVYRRMRMSVQSVEIRNSDGQYVAVQQAPIQLDLNLASGIELEAGDSRCLLLSWDLTNSLLPDNSVSPALYVIPPLQQLPIDLVFVTCPDIDTIFVIRSDKNWVVDSFAVNGRPVYLTVDPDPSRPRFYVLTSADKMVKVFSVANYKQVDFFQPPLNDAPNFMTISPDGRSGYLLDETSGFITRINLLSGEIMARSRLNYRPSHVLYLEQQDALAVSLSLSQQVLLLDPLTLETRARISTGNSPQGLAVFLNQLYIAEAGDNTVSVIGLNGEESSRQNVGLRPRRVQVAGDQVFVSNYLDESLSVLVPGQLGVFRDIPEVGRVREMGYNEFFRKLYATDEKAGALAVIDVNSNRLVRRISLGAKPLDLLVVQ